MDPRLNLILTSKKEVHTKIGACIRPVTILTLSDLTINNEIDMTVPLQVIVHNNS